MLSFLFLLFITAIPLEETNIQPISLKQNRVYLASYPRSGNTWTRQLIEEATHKVTTAVHVPDKIKDQKIRDPFSGYYYEHGYEGTAMYPEAGDSVVIKTHFPAGKTSVFDQLPYKKTIHLVRHPIDSLYSHYVFKQHRLKQPKENLVPEKFLLQAIQNLCTFEKYWNEKENVLTVRYEDLLESPDVYLEQILQTLDYKTTKEDILRAIAKYPPTGHPLKHLSHFNQQGLEIIQMHLSEFMEKHGYKIPEDLSFSQKENRIYLATFPRSGNTWVRQLIEEATHKITAAVYKDTQPKHLMLENTSTGYYCEHGYEGSATFPEKGEPILIKTHFPSTKQSIYDLLPYQKTIRIIRHPIDSFYSFYTLKMNNLEKKPEYLIPRRFLLQAIHSWTDFQKYWDKQEHVLTIHYESLLNAPFETLQLILQTIGYEVEADDILRAITKYPPIDHSLKHISHFTQEDLLIIEEKLFEFMQKYDYKTTRINNS